jgi:hypothetical protein
MGFHRDPTAKPLTRRRFVEERAWVGAALGKSAVQTGLPVLVGNRFDHYGGETVRTDNYWASRCGTARL